MLLVKNQNSQYTAVNVSNTDQIIRDHVVLMPDPMTTVS